MPAASRDNPTTLLVAAGGGDEAAAGRLLPIVYDELRDLARGMLRRERSDHTLQATALVHEAYLRLVDQRRARPRDRRHFVRLAAQAMRRALVDHARAKLADKRGGGRLKLTLEEATVPPGAGDVDVLALDDALNRLAALNPRHAQVVNLRFFGCLTINETAETLGVSHATVESDWRMARAWLHRNMVTDSGQ